MKHFLAISFGVLNFIYSATAIAEDSPELLPSCYQTDFNLCGFIDAKAFKNHGQRIFVIEPKYGHVKPFSNGLAAVQIGGTYGYIDASDNIVIAPQFERVETFDKGLAVAGKPGAYGIIDKSGNYVVEPIFSHAKIFSDEIVFGVSIENAKTGSIGFGDYAINGAGLYSISSGWVTEQNYNFEKFGGSELGLIWAQVPLGKRGTWDDEYGLMRVDGSWLIEPEYSYVEELKYNRAVVRKRINGESVSGAVDKDGREVIPFIFDYLTQWDSQFLQVGLGSYPDRKMGLVTFDGQLLAGKYFDEIERPNRIIGPNHPPQDFYTVKDAGESKTLTKDGMLLSDQRVGQKFLECEFFTIFYDTQGYALVPKDPKLARVTFDKPLYSYSNQNCTQPPTLVKDDNYAVVLENGEIFGGFFENSKGFFGTHRWVRVEGKWGLVGREGGFSIEPIYSSVSSEADPQQRNDLPIIETSTTYKVIKNDEAYRLSFVDGKYKEMPFTDVPEDRSGVLNCKGKYRRKSKNGLWGIFDEKGKALIPPQYRAITCFSSGVVWVPDDTKQQWCPVDRNNRIRSAPACVTTQYSGWISHHSPEKFDDDQYESSVLWMKALLDYGEGRRDEKPRFVPWDK